MKIILEMKKRCLVLLLVFRLFIQPVFNILSIE